MEKSTPMRKPHTSTADLLTWPENQPFESPAAAASRSVTRSHQPSDGISKVVFGGQVTDEEVESLNKRKPCSNYKMKEITGSGIFSVYEENDASETGSANPGTNGKTRTYQPPAAIVSHISFGEEEIVTPKKPSTVPEVAKQRELSGTLQSQSDAKLNKQFSDSKFKELSGHNIFAPPPEIKLRPTVRALAYKDNFDLGESDTKPDGELKTAKKIPDRKFTELSGNNIFKGDVTSSPSAATAEKLLSTAKLKEISGNDIFADAKAQSRDYFGGVRKPPGGESSIALV
ncbi:hypothetical protein EUTSA_v10001828mg [Eutrema salsugineum]|uniref:DUF4057 domain-containing protein n=1 Tax=Eutrema salsugineum TaxID=72664 RepID=V4N1G4_EUTSA|nr:uncharacterized protein LOC18015399 isoform X2 [Eutrema salsugineum]ESQ38931.1 hypothetical protein EUTSA_v10001828mg [Eutrema salsugineum]